MSFHSGEYGEQTAGLVAVACEELAGTGIELAPNARNTLNESIMRGAGEIRIDTLVEDESNPLTQVVRENVRELAKQARSDGIQQIDAQYLLEFTQGKCKNWPFCF